MKEGCYPILKKINTSYRRLARLKKELNDEKLFQQYREEHNEEVDNKKSTRLEKRIMNAQSQLESLLGEIIEEIE